MTELFRMRCVAASICQLVVKAVAELAQIDEWIDAAIVPIRKMDIHPMRVRSVNVAAPQMRSSRIQTQMQKNGLQ